MLKKLAAAALMLCATSAALADDQNLGTITVPSSPAKYYAVVTHEFGSFIDTLTFTVPTGSLGVAANILPVPDPTDPSNFAGHISTLTYGIWQGNNNVATFAGGMGVSHTVLQAGQYTLSIGGNADGTEGGTYGVSLSVSAVPEPATYGMMLVGLGLLGFASRRRDSSNDKFM